MHNTYAEPQGNLLQLSFMLSNAAVGINFWKVWSVSLRETANSSRAITRFPRFLK